MHDITTRIPIQRLANGRDLPLPARATPDAAGMDLYAAVADEVVLAPGDRALIPTGIALAVPAGHEAQIRPRSGLALKHGVTVLNGPGTIDADYRGEVGVVLANFGDAEFRVARGDRIAQLVVAAVARVTWTRQNELAASGRGAGGFGSTGAGS
ncbi:MAG: dUTP diphosphatase [Alphaproteobacteria bacterium]|nr:dUTP diphosphatase [Alphaproteobacteria bacterium]